MLPSTLWSSLITQYIFISLLSKDNSINTLFMVTWIIYGCKYVALLYYSWILDFSNNNIENICDSDYQTDYRYCDKNEQFHVQNVVKKPGCETFDIDFGDNLGVAGAKKKPELTVRKSAVKRVPKSPSPTKKSPVSKNVSRRPLKKVEKDETNNAIRRIMTGKNNKNTRPTSVGRFETRVANKKPSTQGIF